MDSPRPRHWLRLAVVGMAFLCLVTGARPARGQQEETAAAARLSAAVRAAIEPGYRERAGVGFASFRCGIEAPPRPGGFLNCDAVDDEGDPLRLTLAVDDKGRAEVFLASRPASALDATERAELAALESPCKAFLRGYADGEWDAAYSRLHPAAQDVVSLDQFTADLAKLRGALGEVRSVELRSIAQRLPDGNELEYALTSENGPAVARFQVHVGDDAFRLLAYQLSAEPGSPVHATLLQEVFRDSMTALVGEPVAALELRFDAVARVGDAVEGKALLASGSDVPIRLEQIRRFDDFDTDKYSLELLDAPLLIERYLRGRSESVESVDCPTRIVANGGSETCEAILTGGARIAITIMRRDGNHRVTDERPKP